MAKASERDLRLLSALESPRIHDLKLGARIVGRTGYEVDALIARVALDRLALGAQLHRQARAALRGNPRSYRSTISRAYYAMYQTFRGIVFLVTEGDDHEKHTELPQHLPKDFPGGGYWDMF